MYNAPIEESYIKMGLKDKTRTNKLTSDCLLLLKVNGFMAWRQNNAPTPRIDPITKKIIGVRTMAAGSRKGIPDIFAVSSPYGTLIGLEIKVGKDRQSEDQIEFMNDMLKVKAKYYIITEIDDLVRLLDNGEMRHLPKGGC